MAGAGLPEDLGLGLLGFADGVALDDELAVLAAAGHQAVGREQGRDEIGAGREAVLRDRRERPGQGAKTISGGRILHPIRREPMDGQGHQHRGDEVKADDADCGIT